MRGFEGLGRGPCLCTPPPSESTHTRMNPCEPHPTAVFKRKPAAGCPHPGLPGRPPVLHRSPQLLLQGPQLPLQLLSPEVAGPGHRRRLWGLWGAGSQDRVLQRETRVRVAQAAVPHAQPTS